MAKLIERAQAFVTQKGIGWLQARTDSIEQLAGRRFRVRVYPLKLLLDPQGRILLRRVLSLRKNARPMKAGGPAASYTCTSNCLKIRRGFCNDFFCSVFACRDTCVAESGIASAPVSASLGSSSGARRTAGGASA